MRIPDIGTMAIESTTGRMDTTAIARKSPCLAG
jgi:hypothetical protein